MNLLVSSGPAPPSALTKRTGLGGEVGGVYAVTHSYYSLILGSTSRILSLPLYQRHFFPLLRGPSTPANQEGADLSSDE